MSSLFAFGMFLLELNDRPTNKVNSGCHADTHDTWNGANKWLPRLILMLML